MPSHPCATFSLILRDPATGWIGSGVTSKYLAVGGAVSHSLPSVGIVHTQFWCSHDLANQILAQMAAGAPPQTALKNSLNKDDLPQKRQLLVMDATGRTAVHTGLAAESSYADFAKPNLVAAGNTLASKAVVEAMVRTAEASHGQPLLLRLILALQAAEDAGGDHRGKQSAAVRILQPMDKPWTDDQILDLRVDDHPEPIKELWRLYDLSIGNDPASP